MSEMKASRLTRVYLHLDRLTHNLQLLQAQVGAVPLWPVIKANAYGHGAAPVARHLRELGYRTLGVADVAEAAFLADKGIEATFIVLSATLPEHSEALVASGCEPAVCTREMVDALDRAAGKQGQRVSVHVKVDTGMGRVGIRPDEVVDFLEHCRALPALHVRGIMSHFPRADEADKAYSIAQLQGFRKVLAATVSYGIEVRHMANSAGILDIPGSQLDAVRPGIAMYGLRPSQAIANPRVNDLAPVLEWKTRIVYLKEVPAGTGLSYGHAWRAPAAALIATVPVGYGDGLRRNLSNNLDMLVHGERCSQVGRITMDMSLLDVSALRDRVALGDEVVIIGRQGSEQVTADELAAKLDTINYEIATGIAQRIPRIVINGKADAGLGSE